MKEATGTAEGVPARLPDGREAYIFDSKKFDQQTEAFVRLHIEHGKRNPKYWNQKRIESDTRFEREERAKLKKWAEKYSGKIPESWSSAWYSIEQDVANPKNELTDSQVFAAIEFPHWQVQQALGMNRSLTSVQLNALALTHYHSIFTFQEVLDKQLKLGASYQSVKSARFIFSAADEVMIAQAELGIPVP